MKANSKAERFVGTMTNLERVHLIQQTEGHVGYLNSMAVVVPLGKSTHYHVGIAYRINLGNTCTVYTWWYLHSCKCTCKQTFPCSIVQNVYFCFRKSKGCSVSTDVYMYLVYVILLDNSIKCRVKVIQ